MRSLGLLNNHSSNTTQTTNNYEHLKKIINGEVINKETMVINQAKKWGSNKSNHPSNDNIWLWPNQPRTGQTGLIPNLSIEPSILKFF